MTIHTLSKELLVAGWCLEDRCRRRRMGWAGPFLFLLFGASFTASFGVFLEAADFTDAEDMAGS